MREVTVDGKTAWLVDHPSDWLVLPILRLTVPVSIERGMTGRENRRPAGATLRAEMEWQSVLPAAAAQSLLSGLQAYAGVPLIVPVWPLATCAGDPEELALVGGLLVAWRKEATEWAIGSSIGDPTAWEWIAPAIVGAFGRAPEAFALSPELFRVSFSVQEDGPAAYALTPPAYTFLPGPSLPDGTHPSVFPWPVNWTNATRAATADLEIDRRDLGPGRESASAIYPQEAERPVEGLITLSGSTDIALFLAWWFQEGGNAAGHWTSSLAAPTRLVADSLAGATQLTVAAAGALQPELAILLHTSYGPTEAARIASVAGNQVTLAAPLANAWEADEAVLMPLMLARHARAVVELTFYSLGLAETRMAWREVSAEDVLPVDEVRGSTIGRLPERAWLYTLHMDRIGAVSTERFTSYEDDLVSAGEFFVSRPCDHSEIRQTIRLDRDEITLSLRWWPGCPLSAFLPGKLDTLVRLVIEACEPKNGQGLNPRQRFNGQITGVEFDGPYLQASAAGASSLFDRQVPALLFSRICNWDVYGRGCGLAKADWQFFAQVQSVVGTRLVLHNFTAPTGTGGVMPPGLNTQVDWFALGILARGDGLSASFISRSSTFSAGILTVELDRSLSPQVIPGATVSLVPGCDGRSATCRAYVAVSNPEGKFNNFARFGAFPEIPETNPVVQPMGTPTGGGKK